MSHVGVSQRGLNCWQDKTRAIHQPQAWQHILAAMVKLEVVDAVQCLEAAMEQCVQGQG
jgi:hypothetical protein